MLRILADSGYRLLFRAGYGPARLWWRLRRPHHIGALVAVWAAHDRLLVVRQSYRPAWTLPGGGVRRGETPGAAAVRELAEEVGLEVRAAHLVPAVEVTGAWDYRRERVHIFELHLANEPRLRLDGREVVEARFVDWASLAGMALTSPAEAYATVATAARLER